MTTPAPLDGALACPSCGEGAFLHEDALLAHELECTRKLVTDLSCEHRSRWMWSTGLARWYRVVTAPGCACEKPDFVPGRAVDEAERLRRQKDATS